MKMNKYEAASAAAIDNAMKAMDHLMAVLMLCGVTVAWVGWSTLRHGVDRSARPRPGSLAHAPHKQASATQNAAAKKAAKRPPLLVRQGCASVRR
jgi:hypothetical protein